MQIGISTAFSLLKTYTPSHPGQTGCPASPEERLTMPTNGNDKTEQFPRPQGLGQPNPYAPRYNQPPQYNRPGQPLNNSAGNPAGPTGMGYTNPGQPSWGQSNTGYGDPNNSWGAQPHGHPKPYSGPAPHNRPNSHTPPEPPRKRNNSTLILSILVIILSLLLLAAVAYFFFTTRSNNDAQQANPTSSAAGPAESKDPSSAGSSTESTESESSSEPSESKRAEDFRVPSSWNKCSGSGAPGDLNLTYAEDYGGNTTSCPFASNVRDAFVDHYRKTDQLSGTVEATSPTTGETYTMSCRDNGTYVTCTGGNNARVYIL